ncbi:Pirin-related protein [Sanguibacter keddieii DSM 10542]|uniref:Pirin-related protein n=1 Tax=Sanguibacter keddieii (strain ATCC 51767 / DSM 10542 / NCFB 3025 / ST-74) TaxID=446469 RepID=D1BFD8_SANKS|nr:pirin family protein [Sanguibacter keddieii]ACZ23441.1 Pirin-related protein [Sanguibacter keddieii DSM 10542]
MSNLDAAPTEQTCASGQSRQADGSGQSSQPAPGRTGHQAHQVGVEILEPREVPLGGARAMTVRRTLPQRARSMVGAWCFLDHFGPDDVTAGPGMQVPPHPHTGLQTVTWLFAGEIEHHDSVGSDCRVRPGELNLMTSGHGISHSEHSPDDRTTTTLHGVQLWTALPHASADVAPAFEHHEDLPVLQAAGARVQVFLGALPAQPGLGRPEPLVSPATTYTELLGAQVDLEAGATLVLQVDPDHEHAVLVDSGEGVTVDGEQVVADHLGYVAPGRRGLALTTTTRARLVLLGGRPSTEEIVMWWNFVGRSHDEVVAARADWQRQNGHADRDTLDAGRTPTGQESPSTSRPGDARFGTVVGYDGAPLPAPVLPNVRLAPRRNPS